MSENLYGSVSVAQNRYSVPLAHVHPKALCPVRNLAYLIGHSFVLLGVLLIHLCFSLGRNLAYLSPPKRASPDSPWLAHSVPIPYGINLGHRGLRFCTATEQHRPDFHWFGNVLFNSRAQRLATSSPSGDTGGWRDADSPTKRTNPKVTKKANLAVRIQPSACTHCY